MKKPRVFVSHSSKDKARFVTSFVERLRGSGINAWVDALEILPGDSLVEKIFEEGLEQADAVIAVVSEHSIDAPWVKAELDHAVVKNIEDKARLIPVILGDCKAPAALRSKRWIKIGDLKEYDDELSQIVDTLLGRSSKLPTGPPPAYLRATLPTAYDLTHTDVFVFRALIRFALDNNTTQLGLNDITRATEGSELSERLIHESIEALANAHLLKATQMPNDGTLRLVRFEDRAFFRYLELFMDVNGLTSNVQALIVNEEVRDGSKIAERLNEHPLIVFALLENLREKGLLKLASTGNGNAQFGKVIRILNVSPQLRRRLE